MATQKVIVSGTEVPNIKSLTVKAEPLWGDGTGRDTLDGHYAGTFIGYFTTLEIEFEKVTNSEFNTIKNLLEHPTLESVQYSLESDQGDYKQGVLYTEDFYNGTAIEAKPLSLSGYFDEFTVTLVAINRREKLS